MIRTTAPVISGGRVTIAHPIRVKLGIEEGDLIEIEIEPVVGEE